jgi:hypothetical protein
MNYSLLASKIYYILASMLGVVYLIYLSCFHNNSYDFFVIKWLHQYFLILKILNLKILSND